VPSRLIREGILTSDRIEQLDFPAEVFYRRLMSKVDDHGLYDARPSVLRTSLYPLRVDRVREADCSRWIAACEKAGLIALYEHGGKPYLQMLDTRWAARSEPKYPLPTSENSCKQPQTPVPVFGVVGVVEVDKGRKRPSFASEEIELPAWLARDLWASWCADRKQRGKAITDAGARMQIKKLEEYRAQGFTPREVIEHCIAGGFQGLYAPSRKGAQPQTVASSSNAAEETRKYLESKEMTPEERESAKKARDLALSALKLNRKDAA